MLDLQPAVSSRRSVVLDAFSKEEDRRRELALLLRAAEARMIESKAKHSRRWADYTRFYRGDHYKNPPVGDDSRVICNQIGKLVKACGPLVTMGRIRGEITARTPQAEMHALLYQARIDEICDDSIIDTVQAMMMCDCLVLGIGCCEVWYDERDGASGRHRVDWLDPYSVFVDKDSVNPETIRHMAIRRIYTMAEARTLFPEYADELVSEKIDASTRDTGGLYRPIEDVPSENPWGEQILGDTDGLGGELSIRTRKGGGPDRYGEEEEVHVWEHYIRVDKAEAELDRAVDEASGMNQSALADAENSMMAKGEEVALNPDDDDAVHFSSHRKYARSRGRSMNQDEAELLVAHMEAHQARISNPAKRAQREKKYPGGWRLIQRCGDLILYDGETKTGSPYLPVAFVRNYEDNGTFWGLSEVVDMEPMQVALNQVLSQILDLIRFAAHRPLLVDSSQGITEEQLIAQIGLILWVNREKGVPPVEWADPLQLDQSWQLYAQYLNRAMLDQAGLSEIIEGGLPGSGLSGNALAVIKEASLTRTQKRAMAMESAWAQATRALVAQVMRFDMQPMTVKVKGKRWEGVPAMTPSIREKDTNFLALNGRGPSGSVINGLQQVRMADLGVKVDASATAAKGKTQRRNELVGLYKDGVIGPRALRQMLVGLGVITAQEDAMIEAEMMEMQQMQMGAAQAPQPTPRASEPVESEEPVTA